MNTRISSKGQIVLPAEIRNEDEIQAGQEFEVQRLEKGHYLLKAKPRHANEGFVQALLSCPDKNWFEPYDWKEITADYDPPAFE